MQSINKRFQHKHLSAKISADDVDLDIDAEPYEFEELTQLRDRLNETKSKMDKFYLGSKTSKDLAKKWWTLQSIVDIYRPLRNIVEERYNAQIVTNAWLKYYELYSQYDIVPQGAKKFLAFFNAELPGAALCAFNHYMATMRPNCDFDWRASSLAPDREDSAVLGDNYGLYSSNKDKWLMEIGTAPGRNDGDATKLENIRDWAEKLSALGGADLYSHDAGIDVSEDFNRQEEANARIHLGCALAGFMCLKKGGAFIAKQYTFFETLTWNLIIVYSTLFDEFYICKPLTSRPYNSEIYLVGKGFRGLNDDVRKILEDKLVVPEKDFMRPIIPKGALKVKLSPQASEIIRFARLLFGQQIQFIEENLKLFDRWSGNLNTLAKAIDPLKRERHQNWLKLYPMKPIDRSKWLAAQLKS